LLPRIQLCDIASRHPDMFDAGITALVQLPNPQARAAIEAGYERAWYAIRDSNVTTFCSGLILFQFGSGPVRGFAVTLCLGILTSLATGVFGTRVVYDFLTSRRRLATVSV